MSTFFSATISSLIPYFISLILLIFLFEQISYLKKKRSVPGPSLVLPFLGNAISLISNPSKFWEDQSSFAKSSGFGFSANYIIGNFIIFIRDTELSHRIFSNVRPDAFHLVGHPFGKKLFGEHNLIYMMGQDHKDLRRQIAPNFTHCPLLVQLPSASHPPKPSPAMVARTQHLRQTQLLHLMQYKWNE